MSASGLWPPYPPLAALGEILSLVAFGEDLRSFCHRLGIFLYQDIRERTYKPQLPHEIWFPCTTLGGL